MDSFNEQEFEKILEVMRKAEKASENSVAVLSAPRMEAIDFCERVCKMIFAEAEDVKVTTTLHKPYRSMGNVTVEGPEIIVSGKHMEWFCRAAEFADNTEIYCQTNGMTKLVFTFHGLTQRIN